MEIILLILIFIIIEISIVVAAYKKKKIFKLDLCIESEYVKQRFKERVEWYEKYAFIYKWKYVAYSMITIVLSSSISILSLGEYKIESVGIKENKILIGWVSTIITIITGYLYLRSPKERWHIYRKYSELLQRELSLKYFKKQTDEEFLEKIEEIMQLELDNWNKIQEKQSREEIKDI